MVTRVIKVGLDLLDFRDFKDSRVTLERPDPQDLRD